MTIVGLAIQDIFRHLWAAVGLFCEMIDEQLFYFVQRVFVGFGEEF